MPAAVPQSRRVFLVMLFLVSLAVNLGYVLGIEPWLAVESDAASYDAGGWDLARGMGFPTAGLQPKREPGIYAFFGGVYSVFGHSHRAARIVQALMTASFCLLVFLLASRLAGAGVLPAQAPPVAAVLTAAYPGFVFYSGVLMRETLITFLALVSLVFLTAYVTAGRLRQAACYGVFAGLGALVDGRFLFFVPFVALAFLLTGRGVRNSVAFGVVAGGMALLVIAPWTIRNYVVLDKFVLLSTSQYKGLWLVTNPDGIDEWDWEREPLRSLRDLPMDERDQRLAELATQNLRDYPIRYAVSSVGRFFRLWWGGSHSNVMPLLVRPLGPALQSGDWSYALLKLLLLAVSYAYVFGGFIGAGWVMLRAGVAPVVHLVAFLVYFSILHMILFSTPRYHIPAAPVLAVFAAGWCAHLWASRSWRRVPSASAAFTVGRPVGSQRAH